MLSNVMGGFSELCAPLVVLYLVGPADQVKGGLGPSHQYSVLLGTHRYKAPPALNHTTRFLLLPLNVFPHSLPVLQIDITCIFAFPYSIGNTSVISN